MKARLQGLYESNYRERLKKTLNIHQPMRLPRMIKIVLNMGVKDAVADSKVLIEVQKILSKIAGQMAVRTRARKSIAGFKLRQGNYIGAMVTLRRKKMYDFLDKFINLALPCVRDFHGLNVKLDGKGNYNIGIKDWMIFPEIDYDEVNSSRGFNITIETSTSNDHEARELLRCFNIPFKGDQ